MTKKQTYFKDTKVARPASELLEDRELYTVVWSFQRIGEVFDSPRCFSIGSLIFDNEEEAKKALEKIDKELGSDIFNFISAVHKRKGLKSAKDVLNEQ